MTDISMLLLGAAGYMALHLFTELWLTPNLRRLAPERWPLFYAGAAIWMLATYWALY